MKKFSLLDLSEISPSDQEFFETITEGKNVRIERIVSSGQISPDGFWYDQDDHEWVLVLQGEAELLMEKEGPVKLETGDYLFIPAHQLHRVTFTSASPPCIWLTVFFRDDD